MSKSNKGLQEFKLSRVSTRKLDNPFSRQITRDMVEKARRDAEWEQQLFWRWWTEQEPSGE